MYKEMANNALSTHSVQFDSNNVDFDLIAFSDLSGTMTSEFTFKDIFYQKGFTGADSSAVAVIDVSASDYSNLFKLNIPIFDPSSGVVDTDSVRYLTKSAQWSDVSFSSADVSSGAIFASHSNQTIKKDFLRSMLKDITGTTRLNNLFKNQNTMLTHIEGLDASFNAEIKSVLSAIEGAGWLTDADYGVLQDNSTNYTFAGVFQNYSAGEDISDISAGYAALAANTAFSKFNPLRILSSSILGEEDADETDDLDISGTGLGNSTRRETLINSLKTQVDAFWSSADSDAAFVGVDDQNDTYTIYLKDDAVPNGTTATAVNGSLYSSYLNDFTLYQVDNSPTLTDANSLIRNVVDKEYDFGFIAGDNLHLLITYKPKEDTYGLLSTTPAINDRTYEVVLRMS
tara:strand:+ start:1173 stop:2372 length:1200 start_codon:yes stop_codon:yes gene_type:complete